MFVYFSMPNHVFRLCFFYGRPFFFLCFGVSSHWESLVLGYVDVESV